MKKNLLGISLLTMTCLYGLLAAIIILVCMYTTIPIIYGIVASIIILILQFLISPFLTDITMKWFYGATFENNLPDYVNNFIDQICNKYNMKKPKIGYIDDGAPNAFTYGRTKNDARVILTRGIFEILTPEEVLTVVAHELGHVTHYDMLFITVAQLVPLVLYGIYETFTKSSSNNKNNNNSYAAIIGLIAYILYIISQYIVLFLSRTREYYADSFSVEETRNPNALSQALIKIGYGLTTRANNETDKKKKHSAAKSNALGIFDSKTSKTLVVSSFDEGMISKENIKKAMKWEEWNIWAKFYELSSTHPLISKRINAISKRSSEFNQQPFINFDLQKPESYVDDFVIELIIKYLPLFSLVILTIISLLLVPMGNTQLSVLIIIIGGIITILLSYIKYARYYNNKNYKQAKVSDLLSEVKVSGVTSIPCEIEGKIIGRGNPGCILSEDFVIQDETGIIFLDYNQPLKIVNKLFAIFKSKEYFDKTVKIKGWYRRSPVPYIEIKTMEIDGKIKKIHTYIWSLALRFILIIIYILFLLSFATILSI